MGIIWDEYEMCMEAVKPTYVKFICSHFIVYALPPWFNISALLPYLLGVERQVI